MAPIMATLDWNKNFDLMCDASDFSIGATLGQRTEKPSEPFIMLAKPPMKLKKTIQP